MKITHRALIIKISDALSICSHLNSFMTQEPIPMSGSDFFLSSFYRARHQLPVHLRRTQISQHALLTYLQWEPTGVTPETRWASNLEKSTLVKKKIRLIHVNTAYTNTEVRVTFARVSSPPSMRKSQWILFLGGAAATSSVSHVVIKCVICWYF